MLYACDRQWWEAHDFVRHFPGERWTQNRTDKRAGMDSWQTRARDNGLRIIKSKPGHATPDEDGTISDGCNSTFQALGIACLLGATRVILLGLDLGHDAGRSHFFGDHPKAIQKGSNYEMFRRAFTLAAPEYEARGVTILNCSRRTSLECFPRVPLEEAL